MMATLETRDFLGIIDHHLHSSSSSSSPLHFSLRATESDNSNNAERVNEEEAPTANPAVSDYSTTHAQDHTFLHRGNVYINHNICPLDLLTPALLRDSITPPRIPLKRKASLARFLQMRNERVQKLRLNARNGSSVRSATFLQLMSDRKSDAIPPHTEFEFCLPSVKRQRQCLQSLQAQ